MRRYAYEIYLDGELIDESAYEYETKEEAESEGNFNVSTQAECRDRHWSEFTVVIREA